MRSTLHWKSIRLEMPPLLRLALPLILGELGWNAMSVVDTVLVGRLPNSAVSMAAASLAQVLFNVLMFGVGGVLLGLDSLISQAYGARRQDEANRWLLHGLVLALALSCALMLVFYFGAPAVLAGLPVDRAVLALAIPALRGLNYGTLPLLLYFTLRRYLQGVHIGRPIAYSLISANLINVGADWLLIFGHHWRYLSIPAFGVTGSSWATSFSRLYLGVFLLAAVWLADRKHRFGLLKSSRKIEFAHLRRLFLLGAPAGFSIFIEVGIFALVTTMIATLGPLALAGHEVALQCASTTFMVPFAISSATSVRVGHAIGRRSAGLGPADAAAAAGWSGILAGAAIMLVFSLAFLAIPAQIARMFTPDHGVIAAAVPLLLIAAGFQFFDGIQINATGALRGAARTTAPLLTQLACYWVFGMPLGVYLGFHQKMGAAGLWLGLFLALAAAAAVLLTVWSRAARSLSAS